MGKWFNNLVKMIDDENKKKQVITEPDSDTETAGEKAEENLNEPDEPDAKPEPDEPDGKTEPEPDDNNSNDNND